MEHDKMASMLAEIVGGVPKAESRYAIDEESGGIWDSLEKDIAKIREENPEAVIDIPSEIP